MSIESVEQTAIKDVGEVLVKLAADMDKIRPVADKINATVQNLDHDWFASLPGVGPLAALAAELASGFDLLVDAIDDVVDGIASNAGVPRPAPQVSVGPTGAELVK